MRAAVIVSAALVVYAAWRASQEIEVDAAVAWVSDSAGGVMSAVRNAVGLWRAPEKYAPMIAAAEQRHGLPAGLLERLLWQESRYREDIISGQTKSPVGAVGIAQFMPATARDLNINPLDVAQAINGAGAYLAMLYRRLGSWAEALAAYNWGIGNVQRKGLAAAPAETRAYYRDILADVGLA